MLRPLQTSIGRRGHRLYFASLFAGICVAGNCARADLWVTGYYPGYDQAAMPASAIDFGVITHLIHFAVLANTDGTLNTAGNNLTLANSTDAVSHAHAAGRKILICVGGAGGAAGFQGATASANRGTFITNLVNFMTGRNYDGIDIDWEPLNGSDANQYTNFINGLRTALDAINPRPLLSAAMASPPTPASLIASLQNKFDQINLMTYDMSGPYPGWVTWHNAPIYDGGYRFPSTGGLVPSADGEVQSLINAGVLPGKLGIGIAFYGYIWSGGAGTTTGGVTQPRQAYTTDPTTSTAAYNTIMATYYQSNLYHWDTGGQAAYLGMDNAGSSNDKFISYDDERTCRSKVAYARNMKLGGVMIWEISQDHHAGQADPLLTAIKQSLATPGPLTLQTVGSEYDLSFSVLPLGSYRVQWRSNLIQGAWNTLLVTNITDAGGTLHIRDAAVPGQSARYYRVQTPP